MTMYRQAILNFRAKPAEREYNLTMARGWDSKSVEAQIEAKQEVAATVVKTRTADQIQQIIGKRNLELARAKVAHELASSQNPRYSEMLRNSLSELDKKIAAIE